MKHVHYEMIVAKAANMELVVLAKSLKWHEVDDEDYLFFSQHDKYFLCLPQHKEACLHWLNGGDAQYLSGAMEKWINFGSSRYWCGTHLFMRSDASIHIKPKKEKRWIAVLSNGRVSGWHDEGLEMLKQQYNECAGWQFIQIEVEV